LAPYVACCPDASCVHYTRLTFRSLKFIPPGLWLDKSRNIDCAPSSISAMSTTREIEICCISCNSTTSTSRNEWVRCGAAHIWPVQKPWYTATRTEEGESCFPHQPEAFHISAIIVSEVSCSHCGKGLGGYCKSARGGDAKLFKYLDFAVDIPVY
jgi:hypothetical protein